LNRPLGEARIGYAGYSADFRHPGDRRRFSAYAEQKGLAYERADIAKNYDLVLVTHNGDLPGWTARKRREGGRLKFVFELVDSYFVSSGGKRRFLKGLGRRALGTDSRLSADFMKTLIGASEAADAVICSTEEQRGTIRRYNPNVFLSFDWFGGDLGAPKADYTRGDRLRIVWEGQAVTLENLLALREPLNGLRDRIEIHVVTDPVLRRYFGRFGATDSRGILNGIEAPIVFHPWERETFSKLITSSDLAVIPIDTAQAMMRGKPENKLVLLWQLGMPVLTSATPAYERAMAAAGLDMVCRSESEWRAQLERMIEAPAEALAAIGAKGRVHALEAYSTEEFQRRFDAVFRTVGFDPPTSLRGA
jgi:hypothetical protein